MSSQFLDQHAVESFHGRPLPEPGWPVGYARLVDQYRLGVPLPRKLLAVSVRYRKSETDRWLLLGSRSEIPDELGAHLTLALKWEGVDLAVLSALFRSIEPAAITEFVLSRPTSAYGRRVWFLYEWLTGTELPVKDLGKAVAVEAVDPQLQFALAEGELSSRHKVVDNLPGTRWFCPMVRRSEALLQFASSEIFTEAQDIVGRTHPDIIQRAGAFLLLADSRASFQIEGERPSADRLQRWGYAVRDAGQTELSPEELLRLQGLVIGDDRFVRLGLRDAGGFVGLHDRLTRAPIPDHVGARPDDLDGLVRGVIDYVDRTVNRGSDAVAAAAAAAFGFVYIHPFEDGNGRIHRWLLHHVLAAAGLTPKGVVFPVSHVILRRLEEYKQVLESYSKPLLPFVEWEETEDHNVRVTNRTVDYYRYFDATSHAEFLYSCLVETVKKDLPDEVAYLEAFDTFARNLQLTVDMPTHIVDLLVRFLEQNGGTLSKRAASKEFARLRADEVAEIEALYASTLGSLPASLSP